MRCCYLLMLLQAQRVSVHEINWLLFCSSLRFVVCMCLCLFLLEQALFRYEIGFYYVPRYVFLCSLHRPLFAFIAAGLAQKDFLPRCVLVGCLHIL